MSARNQDAKMSKQQALEILKLLSALESWSFSFKEHLPDYLHDNLGRSVEYLESLIIGEDK
jgi:hypothetical protein